MGADDSHYIGYVNGEWIYLESETRGGDATDVPGETTPLHDDYYYYSGGKEVLYYSQYWG